VNNLTVNFSIPADFRRDLINKSAALLKKELNFKVNALVFNFVSSEEILKINSEYLDHHYLTDIITFNYGETNSGLDGEIFISPEEARRNAAKYGNSITEEIIRLVTHGILHLLGYNDTSPREKRIMKELEDKLVKKQISILIK